MNGDSSTEGGGIASASVNVSSAQHARPSASPSRPARPLASTTLSQTIAELQNRLKTAFLPAYNRQHEQYDSTLIHPLAVDLRSHAPAPAPALASSGDSNPNTGGSGSEGTPFALPVPILSYSLQHFENQVLNAGLEGNSSSSITSNEKLRLLSLFRESSALAVQAFATADGSNLTHQILDRRKEYKVKYSLESVGLNDQKVPEIIELLAKECGWEVFPGAEDDDMGDEGGLSLQEQEDGSSTMMMLDVPDADKDTDPQSKAPRLKTKKTTLTVAGKGIVIDVDVDVEQVLPVEVGSQPASTSNDGRDTEDANRQERISAIRFSYGLEGSTDPGIDKMLLRLARNKRWDQLRDALSVLATLDALVENPTDSQMETAGQGTSTADPFGAMKALSLKVEEIFKAELEVVASPAELVTKGHGLSLIYHDLPYLTLLLWLPAASLVSQEWQEAIASGFQNEQLERVQHLQGVVSMTFVVSPSDASTSPPPPSSSAPQVPRNGPAFPLLATTPDGLGAVNAGEMRYLATFSEPVYVTQATARQLHEVIHGLDASMTDSAGYGAPPFMQGPPVMLFENYLLSSGTPIFFGLAQEKQLYETNPVGNPAMRLTHNTLAPAVMSSAVQIVRLTFHTTAQLLRITEILRLQFLYTELVLNTFEGSTLLSAESAMADSQITLNDLLSDSPSKVISLVLDSDLASFPPAVSGTVALPHLPSWLPVTLSFEIMPSLSEAGGYGLSFALDAPPLHAEVGRAIEELLMAENGQEKMQAVLGVSRDAAQLVAWISARLKRQEAQIWQAITDKPDWVR